MALDCTIGMYEKCYVFCHAFFHGIHCTVGFTEGRPVFPDLSCPRSVYLSVICRSLFFENGLFRLIAVFNSSSSILTNRFSITIPLHILSVVCVDDDGVVIVVYTSPAFDLLQTGCSFLHSGYYVRFLSFRIGNSHVDIPSWIHLYLKEAN